MEGKISQGIEEKKEAVKNCIRQYDLEENPAITDEVLAYEGFPSRASKMLAFIILGYKREATTTELKRISDQPAGLVRDLRTLGFLFQDNGKTPPVYFYVNATGETCRRILGFQSPKVKLRGKVKLIIEKSVAACISAIEVYNKPDFRYREETFSILLVNAWELLLKAKILSDNACQIQSIQVTDSTGNFKKNRSGNHLTIDIHNAITKLVTTKTIDDRCWQNIDLLIEIRDNAVHYINKGMDFSKRVQEIGTAGLRNYITAISEWFGRDLSEFNFYLMPMSFFHPNEIDSLSVRSQGKEIERMLQHFKDIETKFPPDEGSPYSIALQIKTKFVKVSGDVPAIEVKYTNKEGAPEVRVSEESVITARYPLSYSVLVEKLRSRYTDFKLNKRFNSIKRDLEDSDKYSERFCKIRYLNVLEEQGIKKRFYSTEILKEFDRHYVRKKT